MTGLFITVEGIEGAGKSTVIRALEQYLRTAGVDLVLTREFGGTEIAEKIRLILLNHHNEPMCLDTEILLAFAARAQHLTRLIIPSLQAGRTVLCDRFTDTTYAYQGAGRGAAQEKIAIIEQWVQGDLRPDFTLLLDLDAQLAMERVKTVRTLDRIEAEKLDFFQRARDCYLQMAQHAPQRYRVVDAAQPVEKVIADMQAILKKICNL